MTATAYALVVVSAATHAYWNFLLKRSGGSDLVVGLSKIAEAVFLVPVLIAGAAVGQPSIVDHWQLPAVGAGLVIANYVLLARAYANGDFSLVYPLSRGAMLVFLPPLAFVTIGERISGAGLAAVSVIVAGMFAAYWTSPERASQRRLAPGVFFALVAALAASAYTLWDKRAVQALAPMLYFAAYTMIVAVAYALMLVRPLVGGCLSSTWRKEWPVVVQIAVFNTISYLLVLIALRSGQTTYVIAVRQLSIVFGALFGAWMLDEAISRSRAAGIAFIVAGCVVLTIVR